MRVNEYHRNYVNLKEQYEKAIEANDWQAVEAIEDEYIDAEFALIEWFKEAVAKHGHDGTQVDETYKLALAQGKEEKIIELALYLSAS